MKNLSKIENTTVFVAYKPRQWSTEGTPDPAGLSKWEAKESPAILK